MIRTLLHCFESCYKYSVAFICIMFTVSRLIPDCVHLLLAHGAPVKVKNLAGWSPLSEAISYGDRRTSKFDSLISFSFAISSKNNSKAEVCDPSYIVIVRFHIYR